ncbi:MAG: excisionase family DNA-binding protein [Myxococcales bacterium]|nr:excisionase family DNA-binding protein [Myxococcales bacterium]
MTPGRYLTTAEAAVRAGVTAKTISRWVDAGVLYAVFTTGGHRRIELSHLDAFLETRRSLFATSPDHHAVVVVASGRGAFVQALQSVVDRRRLGSRLHAAAYPFELGVLVGRERPSLVIIDEAGFGGSASEVVSVLRSPSVLPRSPRIVLVTETPWTFPDRPDAIFSAADPYTPVRALD